jgi:general secretion pathway protein D
MVPTTQPAAATQPAADATTQPATTQPVAAATTQPAPAEAPAVRPVVIRPTARFSLKFTDAPIDAVLDYLSQAAGFVIVRNNGIKLDGRITVDSQHDISPDEAVALLNVLLRGSTNGGSGAVAIRMEGRVLKIMSLDDAKKSGLIPVHFSADPETIAKTDELITQVIPVASVDAVKLKTDLAPLFSSAADVVANQGSNSIVITDSSANIRRVVEIIKSLDTQRTTVSDVRVFQLKYASASAAATLINNIFKPTTNPSGANIPGGPMARFFGGFGGPGGRGGPGGGAAASEGNDGSTIGGQVMASSDDRTNTLVVSGPTGTLLVVERVVKELDANPAAGQVFFIIHLRNADSVNLQSVLNSFFGGTSTSSSSTSRALGAGSTTPFGATSGFGSSGSSGGSRGGGMGGSSMGGSSGFGSASSTSSSSNRATGGGAGSVPTALAANSDLIGHIYVVAEPDTNSLLVLTPGTYEERIRKVLDELDRPVPQVLIKVLIASVQHTDKDDIGFEASVLLDLGHNSKSTVGTNFGIANAIATASPVGAIYQLTSSDLNGALRALATTNKIDVLSRPYILASDNQLASVMSGSVQPYISYTSIATDTGVTTNSVAYQQVGVILNVTPHINPDGLVILDINPQVSSLDTTGSGVVIEPGVTAPVFDLLQAQSRVAVKSGQTIVIGGLMQDTLNDSVDKVPFLGDIPWLGLLFQHRVKTKGKNELLIFLTPHVAQEPGVLLDMSKQEEGASKLIPHAVAPGIYQEQMRGMELGATTLPAATQPAIVRWPAVTPPPAMPPAATQPQEGPPDVPDK